eukprot:1175589-Prorocentrum_minimum.AAC.2
MGQAPRKPDNSGERTRMGDGIEAPSPSGCARRLRPRGPPLLKKTPFFGVSSSFERTVFKEKELLLIRNTDSVSLTCSCWSSSSSMPRAAFFSAATMSGVVCWMYKLQACAARKYVLNIVVISTHASFCPSSISA